MARKQSLQVASATKIFEGAFNACATSAPESNASHVGCPMHGAEGVHKCKLRTDEAYSGQSKEAVQASVGSAQKMDASCVDTVHQGNSKTLVLVKFPWNSSQLAGSCQRPAASVPSSARRRKAARARWRAASLRPLPLGLPPPEPHPRERG